MSTACARVTYKQHDFMAELSACARARVRRTRSIGAAAAQRSKCDVECEAFVASAELDVARDRPTDRDRRSEILMIV